MDKQLRCSICKKKGHGEDTCWSKDGSVASDPKRKCYRCGDEDHIARDCPSKTKGSSNAVQKGSNKKQNSKEQDSFSNYLRVKDCRWCGRTYNSAFSCSGCGKTWPAKSKAEHCLAHCVKYSAASAKERGDMVIKGQNCLICLHPSNRFMLWQRPTAYYLWTGWLQKETSPITSFSTAAYCAVSAGYKHHRGQFFWIWRYLPGG